MQVSSPSETADKLEEHRKELNRQRQIWYRNKRKASNTNTVSEELQHLLASEVPIVVIDSVASSLTSELTNIQTDQSAKFWMAEKDHNSNRTSPKFALCYTHGKVQLPPLTELPAYLLHLYTSNESLPNQFHNNIRGYNNALAYTSFGANIDNQFQGQGVSNFWIHGQVYHPSEIAVIMVGDGYDVNLTNRDILLRLYDRGDDGWHVDIPLTGNIRQKRVTMMQFYSYRLQVKDGNWLHNNNSLQTSAEAEAEPIDKIKMYLDARYISVSESIYRIFHYKMHSRTLLVQRLTVHLPDYQYITFQDGKNLQHVLNRANMHMTILTAWFQENVENIAARIYTYIDFSVYYTWNAFCHKWKPRKNATIMIGRLYMVQTSEEKRYYLRTLLICVRGATSFDDLKTVNEHVCRSFKEVCIRLGLLQDDAEWNACLFEASAIQTEQQLRHLFAMILLFCQPIEPKIL
ncbi:22334_t:CDS:2 [Cetraspora pellucida]|uniref:22334_t:CDS:1 n=1 Tax=Cetraspora pellucida TaxID=1433469 RepID=A0A9N9HNT4_9GLOM|nr:22334_t:CDS:2 [Cetraspora pellucida]